jgi:hypothetical protein
VVNIAKVSINTTIESDIKAKFEIVAKRNFLSYADAMQVAIMEYIQKHEKHNGEIQPEKVKQMILVDESTNIRKALAWARRLYHHPK